jgi:hypothetical protein
MVALLSQSVMLLRSESNAFERHDAGEGREVETLESEFLESLHETRELEADLSAVLRPLLDPQVLVLWLDAAVSCAETCSIPGLNLQSWPCAGLHTACTKLQCLGHLNWKGGACKCRPPALQAPPDSLAYSRTSPKPPASQSASDAGWTHSALLSPAYGTVPRFDTPSQCCRCLFRMKALHSALDRAVVLPTPVQFLPKASCRKRLSAQPATLNVTHPYRAPVKRLERKAQRQRGHFCRRPTRGGWRRCRRSSRARGPAARRRRWHGRHWSHGWRRCGMTWRRRRRRSCAPPTSCWTRCRCDMQRAAWNTSMRSQRKPRRKFHRSRHQAV